MSTTRPWAQAPCIFTLRRATATTTATTAMTMTNIGDEASDASARHFYIASRDGNDNSNYGDDDDKCRQRGLVRKHTTFSYLVAQRRQRQQQSATTNNNCQTTRPRAQAHNIFTSHHAMATTTMAMKTTNNKDDKVIDEASYASVDGHAKLRTKQRSQEPSQP